MPNHVTEQVLDTLIQRWSIDEEWLLRSDHGFSWWGCPLQQRITVEGPRNVGGLETYHLTFEVPIFDVSEVDPAALSALTPLLNRAWNVGMFLVEDGVLKLCGRTYFMEDTAPYRTNQVATAALVAYEYALAKMTDLVPHGSELGIGAARMAAHHHPTQGPRQDLDEMLSIIDAVIKPSGEMPMPDTHRPDMDMAYQALLAKERWMPERTQEGIEGTFVGREGTVMETAVLQYQPLEHPALGRGHLTTFTVEGGVHDTAAEALAAANERCNAWNSLEWRHTGNPPLLSLGAWTTTIGMPNGNPLRSDVVYAQFEPNALGRAESAFLAVVGAFARVELLSGPPPEPSLAA